MTRNRYQHIIACIMAGLMATFLLSCDDNRVFEEYTEIKDSLWDMERTVEFTPLISDTLMISNVYLNIRNNEKYPYSNLFLFVTTTAPNGSWIKDTIEIKMADDKGKWKGKGLGGLYFNKKLFKSNVRFPYPGLYSFKIVHAMRKEELEGIREVGLRIELQDK